MVRPISWRRIVRSWLHRQTQAEHQENARDRREPIQLGRGAFPGVFIAEAQSGELREAIMRVTVARCSPRFYSMV